MVDLSRVGLTDNESKVYVALLDLGPSLAGQIARRSGIHRRTVYDTTETLIKKGLVGYIIKNNRRLFSACDPKRIIELIEEKKKLAEPLVEDLQVKFYQTKEREETLFFKGREGLKTVFEDQLNYSEILILGANKDASKILPYYFKWYDQKRAKKKITTKLITHSRSFSKIKNAQIRYLPEKYSNSLAINIYGDKTAIILWAKKPMAIVIKNKEISAGHRSYFDLMWKLAKE